MPNLVNDIEVRLPKRGSRASSFGARKPMAEVSVILDNGRAREIVVPVRVGRLLKDDAIALPCPEDEAFDAIHMLEGKVCFTLLTEMLSRRDHATEEARAKLALYGFRDQEIDAALAKATDHRFLNDRRFASYFIEERKRRGWGRRKIEQELKHRGVDLDQIEGYPDAFFDPDTDLERALSLLSRKSIPSARPYEKLVRFLMSKGFDYPLASDAVRQRLSAEEDGCEFS